MPHEHVPPDWGHPPSGRPREHRTQIAPLEGDEPAEAGDRANNDEQTDHREAHKEEHRPAYGNRDQAGYERVEGHTPR